MVDRRKQFKDGRILARLGSKDQRPIARIGIDANLGGRQLGNLSLLLLLRTPWLTRAPLLTLLLTCRPTSLLLLLSLLAQLLRALLLLGCPLLLLDLLALLARGVEHLLEDILSGENIDIANAVNADVRRDGEILDSLLQFLHPFVHLVHNPSRTLDHQHALVGVVVDFELFPGEPDLAARMLDRLLLGRLLLRALFAQQRPTGRADQIFNLHRVAHHGITALRSSRVVLHRLRVIRRNIIRLRPLLLGFLLPHHTSRQRLRQAQERTRKHAGMRPIVLGRHNLLHAEVRVSLYRDVEDFNRVLGMVHQDPRRRLVGAHPPRRSERFLHDPLLFRRDHVHIFADQFLDLGEPIFVGVTNNQGVAEHPRFHLRQLIRRFPYLPENRFQVPGRIEGVCVLQFVNPLRQHGSVDVQPSFFAAGLELFDDRVHLSHARFAGGDQQHVGDSIRLEINALRGPGLDDGEPVILVLALGARSRRRTPRPRRGRRLNHVNNQLRQANNVCVPDRIDLDRPTPSGDGVERMDPFDRLVHFVPFPLEPDGAAARRLEDGQA